ncbi:MAG: hypothetical protein VKI81_09365 [Synechococcaceae cyanobacterium]|nr:hypothetical protein [Synechococcaceae cyanobacterium]
MSLVGLLLALVVAALLWPRSLPRPGEDGSRPPAAGTGAIERARRTAAGMEAARRRLEEQINRP